MKTLVILLQPILVFQFTFGQSNVDTLFVAYRHGKMLNLKTQDYNFASLLRRVFRRKAVWVFNPVAPQYISCSWAQMKYTADLRGLFFAKICATNLRRSAGKICTHVWVALINLHKEVEILCTQGMLKKQKDQKIELSKMKTTSLPIIGLIIITLAACGTTQKATTLNPQSKYFPAKAHKVPTVLIDEPTNAANLNKMLLVPNTDYWLAMGKNLNYFDRVLTYEQFERKQEQKSFSTQVSGLYDNASMTNPPFVVLKISDTLKPKNQWFAVLTLTESESNEIIFQNEIRLNLLWDGWTDQGTMFPLLNSLLDYLRKQEYRTSKR